MLNHRRLLSLGLATLTAFSTAFAAEPQLDTDYMLKPLVDTNSVNSQSNTALQPLQGGVEKEGTVPVKTEPPTFVLQGEVKTLQDAIDTETDVDWYGWYLTAREYLGRTGGLECPVGTPIKFYKDGRMEALSNDGLCIGSTAWRRFRLPKQTRLDALILPVRNGHAPAATPKEIYSRINAVKKR